MFLTGDANSGIFGKMHHLDVVGDKVSATPSETLCCVLALPGLFKVKGNTLL